ncbi:MAG: hypothetical protein Fur0010_27600 [Bdellovibrio sp.]
MSKRNKEINVGAESLTLKEMRENSGLSIRKLADLMNLSFSRIHQMESGRENVNEEYVQKFLKVTNHSWLEWIKRTDEGKFRDDLRVKCHETLDTIEPRKLNIIYEFLREM